MGSGILFGIFRLLLLNYHRIFYRKNKFEVKTVGGSIHQEYWIAAQELEEFNNNIIGLIEVIAEYRANTES
jgi:hypothetical protein